MTSMERHDEIHGGSTAVAVEPAPQAPPAETSSPAAAPRAWVPSWASGKWTFRLMVASVCIFAVALAVLVLFPAISTLVSPPADTYTSAP